jgi:hypothetical protein
LKFGVPETWGISEFPTSYFITIGGTTLVWLLVTLFTKPEPMAHLVTYHKQVQPGGWWKPVAEKSGIIVRANTVPLVMAWISSVLMTYATLFAIGQLIFKNFQAGFIFLGVATAAGLFLWLVLREWKLFENEE